MDVIIDTNIIAADFSMRKNHFTNLFDYLKRTNSTLVISKVVWDEVQVKYLEKLKGSINKVNAAWQELTKARFSGGSKPGLPDPKQELERLKERLMNPPKGVKVNIYTDYSRISIDEIVQRGVNRIRPASDAGEELRDVILWLHALDYSKQKSVDIAFIAHDKRFIQKEEDSGGEKQSKDPRPDEIEDDASTHREFKLHPHLQEDVTRHGFQVKFYRTLSAFNKLNTLDAFPATTALLKERGVLETVQQRIGGIIEALLIENQQYAEHISAVKLSKLEFVDGTIYKVSEAAEFAELKFNTKLVLTTEPLRIAYQVDSSIDNSYAANRSFSRVIGNVTAPWNARPSKRAIVNTVTDNVSLWTPVGTKVRNVTIGAEVVISLRLQAVDEFEIESFRFESSDDPLFHTFFISTHLAGSQNLGWGYES